MGPVVILGAGINGAALARELACQGIPVVVVERHDIAAGATAYSSRLIHGGLRYLEQGDFSLVAESLAERERLLKLAPQFVTPLRLHIPVRSRTSGLVTSAARWLGWRVAPRERGLWVIRLGLSLYDWLARGSSLPRHAIERNDAFGTRFSFPPGMAQWRCSYSDAQLRFPERLTLALFEDARRAADETGSTFRLLPHTTPRRSDRGLLLEPAGGEPIEIAEPAAVVNATGAWVDRTWQSLPLDEPRQMAGTKGSHLVLDWPWLAAQLRGEGIYCEAADGRPIFILPWGDLQLIGTTDLPYEGDPLDAVANDDEIDYLFNALASWFQLPANDTPRDHLLLHYSGVRPLPAANERLAPGEVTRRHGVVEHRAAPWPCWSLVGGKLTTCRALGESATDAILARLGRVRRSSTRERLIPGAAVEGSQNGADDRGVERRRLADRAGVSLPTVEQLWPLLGTRTAEPLAAGLTGADARRLVPGTDLPRGVVRWFIEQEWVTTLDDLVERRLMLVYDRRVTRASLDELSRLMADAHRLDPAQAAAAAESTRSRWRRHFGRTVRDA